MKTKTRKFDDGREVQVIDFEVAHPRARHLLRSVLLKRKLIADSYRFMRATLPPHERAEMRVQLNAARRARKGWAAV